MQDRKIVLTALLAILIITSTSATGFAFVQPDGSEDGNFEIFGPRIDRILIKMYGTLDAEIAALQAGEIDITDWALTKPMIDTLSTNPNIGMATYGEAGYYTISLNLNNNSYLGNPPNTLYQNPVFPNPLSELALRQACAYFINRTALTEDFGQGLYDPIYTPIPTYMTYWINPEIRPGATLENLTYPFDPTYATPAAILDNGGFPMGPDGFRYWDMNRNNAKDADEDFNLIVYERADVLRKNAAYMLYDAFENSAIKIHYTPAFYDGNIHVMIEQYYHIYMAGWIMIGPDPDYLWDLYHWDNYYHDGSSMPPNYGSVSIDDPVMQAQLETIKFSDNRTQALQACLAFQERFATTASQIPLGVTSAPKAYSKSYSGGNGGVAVSPDDGENVYRGTNWNDILNQNGFGENSWWSTLNMYPTGFPFGDESHMTVRYGWKETDMPEMVNPLFSSWYWENEICSRIYDSLGVRNPYTMGPIEIPQLAENWTTGLWHNSTSGLDQKTIDVTLRPDVLWNDGVPLTIDDVIYTLIQCPEEIDKKHAGFETWWGPAVDQTAEIFKLDQYSARILMKTNTYLAENWILGNIVLPKHFWQPFIAANTVAVIMGDLGPEQIGTGPFLYESIVPGVSVTLARNPLYYAFSPVDPVIENDPVGVQFLAVPPSNQLSPVKITDSGTGTGQANIIVTLQNHGKTNSAESTFTVTLTRLAGPGMDQTLTSLTTITIGNGSTVIAFDGTRDLAKGKYSIDVLVDTTYQGKSFHYEYHKVVYVTVQGDINEDGVVDIIDIVIVAGHFGSQVGRSGFGLPSFDSSSDLNRDGMVDILDIVKVAGAYGYTYTA